MIKIMGLGPGDKDALTIGALQVIKSATRVYIRTEKHPTIDYIRTLGIDFVTFDDKYEIGNSFDEVYDLIAQNLIDEHDKYGNIVYAVPGHPLVAEKTVTLLIALCKDKNIEYEILPAVSFIDAMMESLRIDPVSGLRIIDSFDLKNQIQDRRSGIIITQVYNNLIASEVKLWLSEYYEDDSEIYFVRAAGVKGIEVIRKIPIYEIDRQKDIDYLTSLYIPKDTRSKDFNDLLEIMDILRGAQGCPWDKEQSHESLKKYLIEESYEVLEAIDEKNDDMLIEELGDVLLQVVFHAKIGKEEGYFNINDVIKGICNKMINRHPHVFGTEIINTSEEVLTTWDKIKKDEKGFDTLTEELKHVGKNLPALMRAEKVQKKASKIGFDFNAVEYAMDKIIEELQEVKDVYKSNNKAKILEEIGDLLFSVVNVSRFLDIEPESALHCTIEKFIKRFDYMERVSLEKGIKLENMSLYDMDLLWNDTKTI
ncbi:MAG: nucleoside triphosphate pyrophosphohydrolase [Clostridiaceae bacterium]|nr:nucleoside triphosphate pyrophosphohydrolase [Clostridiaceae bacterium]